MILVYVLFFPAPNPRTHPHYRPARLHSRVYRCTELWEVQGPGDLTVFLLLLLRQVRKRAGGWG